jgi:hypothetical protein
MGAEVESGTDRPELPTAPKDLEQAIQQRRERLAATIDELALRTQPKEIARRGVAGANRKVAGGVAGANRLVQDATHTSEGELRTERVAAVAAAVGVLLTALVLLRRRRG